MEFPQRAGPEETTQGQMTAHKTIRTIQEKWAKQERAYIRAMASLLYSMSLPPLVEKDHPSVQRIQKLVDAFYVRNKFRSKDGRRLKKFEIYK